MEGEHIVEWKRQDIKYHAAIAKRYDATIREWAIYRDIIINECLNYLNEENKATILDFGCGNGVTALRIAKKGREVIAIDSSKEMVELVKKNAETKGLNDNIYPIIGDGENLPVKDGFFDCIITSGVLHHLPRVETALEEECRVLKEKGRIYILEPNDNTYILSKILFFFIDFPIKSFIRVLRKIVRKHDEKEGEGTKERPISGEKTYEELEKLGLKCEVRYFTHLPFLYAIFPKRMGHRLMNLINKKKLPKGKGDMFFLSGEKGNEKN